MSPSPRESLRPFWRYYGGKWRAAPRYPRPQHQTIVEPFAGAAGYSLRHYSRQVVLVEKSHVVAEIWRYLISESATSIRAIPCVDDVADLPTWVPQAARWLIGFTMNAGVASPRKRLSSGRRELRSRGRMFKGWTERMRERVASQCERIRHWRVIEGDYTEAPDVEATWFVDPPYQGRAGGYYVESEVNYADLAEWCRSRRGQRIVCEQDGASWLPFTSFAAVKSNAMSGRGGTSREALWVAEGGRRGDA